VRRGESDEDAVETSRQVVERGGAVCMFPEGTRIRTGTLAEPKRGVGHLALRTGARVLPVAVFGTRTAEQAAEVSEARENHRYLEGVELPDPVEVLPASAIELAGLDLLCLAIPSGSLPQAVGAIADRISDRSSVLLLTKGLIAPQGKLPSEYVGERVRARALASLGGPAHARESVSGSAALVLASGDPDLRDQLGEVFDRAGLLCERTEDVIGVEMAGAAKNAAVLAAAATEPHGMNAAGIAAAEVWSECIEYAVARGAERETFTGLAGVGDLTATLMAPSGRNRRAGELLGTGTPAEEIPGVIGQASEGLDAVPLLAHALSAADGPAEALAGLAALIEGEIDSEEWVARLRRVERSRRGGSAHERRGQEARLGG
jgi:glycerol-3-phosphate dehydrogenase